ncbi:hypothetical protein AUP68_09772 [Ilyonectria robusta]
MPPESGPGFMWVPVQTPRVNRHAMLDDGTDTDSSPPKMKPLLAAPYTPSGRRSPRPTSSCQALPAGGKHLWLSRAGSVGMAMRFAMLEYREVPGVPIGGWTEAGAKHLRLPNREGD